MIKKIPDEIIVALITGVCIIALSVILKRVLHVEVDSLIVNSPAFLFIGYIMINEKTKKSAKGSKPLLWSLGIIFITALIILINAI